jgi:predicted dithiol-disulfide oxidoreductase (DUF899 family)
MSTHQSPLPEITSQSEWQARRDKLLVKEKELTRALDALAAERRRLPMVCIEKAYRFEAPNRQVSLLDLFEGRGQLIVYHFMFGPTQQAGCPGCSWFTDQIGHLAHLNARDTSLTLISKAPIAKIEAYRRRMGWTLPWVSSFANDFNVDFAVGPAAPNSEAHQDGERFGLSVFLRDGSNVYRTYFTNGRGVERLGNLWTLLDLTPYGRQETWEDSPQGWPQTAPYQWWRRHDEYAHDSNDKRSA